MATHGVNNARQHTSFERLTITSFSGGVDLKTSRPGYNNAQSAGLTPRAFVFPNAGNVVLVDTAGDSDTMTVTAGMIVPTAAASITESGTTITSCTALY